MFHKYNDVDFDSGVVAYRINNNPSSLDVLFRGADRIYRYEESIIGSALFGQMVSAAKNGDDLNKWANLPIFRKDKRFTLLPIDEEARSFIQVF